MWWSPGRAPNTVKKTVELGTQQVTLTVEVERVDIAHMALNAKINHVEAERSRVAGVRATTTTTWAVTSSRRRTNYNFQNTIAPVTPFCGLIDASDSFMSTRHRSTSVSPS
jgi:hypothetical protein